MPPADSEAPRAVEGQLRELIDALPVLVWTARPDGFVDYCSRIWCEYTGLTEAQSLGNGWTTALHPEDQATTGAAVAAAFGRGEAYQVEQRLRRHDGEYRWFLTSGIPVRDSAGKVVRW
ncbi:MAG: PAS domain-containing protein, partial [Deltaproteobacteria bacterium]